MGKKRATTIRINWVAFAALFAMIALASLVSGCGGRPSGGDGTVRDNTPTVLAPYPGGQSTMGNSSVAIDYSNAADGYFMVQYNGDNQNVIMQVGKDGYQNYQFYLTKSTVDTFPLTYGDGTYTVTVYENQDPNGQGDKYSQLFSGSFDAAISDEYLPYLYPNQYVNFNDQSQAVAFGSQLVADATSELDAIYMVFDYLAKNISYDYDKATTLQSGVLPDYLPNIDETLSTKKGICFDFASLMAAILRTQRIPTQLVTGMVNNSVNHAWVAVHTNETGKVFDITFDGSQWKMMDPTLAASSGAAADYVGDGSNYQQLYTY